MNAMNIYRCPQCNKDYSVPLVLLPDIRKYGEEFQCPVCNYGGCTLVQENVNPNEVKRPKMEQAEQKKDQKAAPKGKLNVAQIKEKIQSLFNRKKVLADKIPLLSYKIGVMESYMNDPRNEFTFEEWCLEKGVDFNDYTKQPDFLNFCCLASGDEAFEDEMENYLNFLHTEYHEKCDEFDNCDAKVDELKRSLVGTSDATGETEEYFAASGEKRKKRKENREARKAARKAAKEARKKAKEEWRASGKKGGRKALHKQKKEIRKTKREEQREHAGFARKATGTIWEGFKSVEPTITMVRGLIILFLKFNVFNTASIFKLTSIRKPKEYEKIRLKFRKMGGNRTKFDKAVEKGYKKKPIAARKMNINWDKVASFDANADGDSGNKLTIPQGIIATMPALGSGVGGAIGAASAPVPPAFVAPTAACATLGGVVGGILGGMLEIVNSIGVPLNKDEDNPDINTNPGGIDEETAKDMANTETDFGGEFPAWGWWTIGISASVLFAGIGYALYKKSQKGKKS